MATQEIEVGSPEAYCLDWTDVRGAIVGASIHAQRHQREARKFVSWFADELNRVPSAFFSVSLSAASSNVDEVRAAQALADAFPPAHGWRPAIVASVAGRLAYTRYGFLKRWLMKRIAEKEGAPTDTSRDYEMTNWEELEQFGRALVGLIDERAARKQLAAA
jgi:menaquinone-dependent protoporphyrinogen oxidase